MPNPEHVVRIVRLRGISRSTQERIRTAQMEAAKAWMLCRDLHRHARENSLKWPGKSDLQKATKGLFALHSQSVQMVCHAFLANVATCRELRKQGRKDMRYPYRDKEFYPISWPAQAVCVNGGKIILPMGRGRASLVFDKPDWLCKAASVKLIWSGAEYELHVNTDAPQSTLAIGNNHAAIDLGQIHLATVATNTGHALVVSGRGIRAEKRRMNMMHRVFSQKIARCTKGSRRWKKLRTQRRKHASRIETRIREQRHQATRQAINFCIEHDVSKLFIGDPHGIRRRLSGRHHNQRMSQWEYGRDILYLTEKAKQAGIESFTGSERGTSSQCPHCGQKQKPKGRQWCCRECGFKGHRDVVGAVNMHHQNFGSRVMFPSEKDTTYLRPIRIRGKSTGVNNQTIRK